jgi:hypothetical protein
MLDLRGKMKQTKGIWCARTPHMKCLCTVAMPLRNHVYVIRFSQPFADCICISLSMCYQIYKRKKLCKIGLKRKGRHFLRNFHTKIFFAKICISKIFWNMKRSAFFVNFSNFKNILTFLYFCKFVWNLSYNDLFF